MAVTNLLCLYCGRQAFAVVNLEITAGRARYPVCTGADSTCIERAFNDARLALDHAASKHGVIDAKVSDEQVEAIVKEFR